MFIDNVSLFSDANNGMRLTGGRETDRSVRTLLREETLGSVVYNVKEELTIQQLSAKDGLRTTFRFARKATPQVDTTARVFSDACSITMVSDPVLPVSEPGATPADASTLYSSGSAINNPAGALRGLLMSIFALNNEHTNDAASWTDSAELPPAVIAVQKVMRRAVAGEE